MRIGIIAAVNTGLPAELLHGRQTVWSGIGKQAREGLVAIGRNGPEGDAQADRVNHGGPDKAVCVYIHEHYPFWEQKLDKTLAFGAFGENLTLSGSDERQVFIGDILTAGTAVFQVSQPRQPCFKLGLVHVQAELPLLVQQTGRTGFYLRVLSEGSVQAGDEMLLRERLNPDMSIAEANAVYYDGKKDAAQMSRLAEIPELAESWKNTLQSRMAKLSQ